jgi:2-oxoglutarate ferredoxin oxidoreductase subunit alpha
MQRSAICVVGESGSGLLSVGKITCEALRNKGYYENADREYPSLIKGGQSSFTINFSDEPLYGLYKQNDILISIDKKSAFKFFDRLKDGGIWIHGYERPDGIKELTTEAKKRNITVLHLPIIEVSHEMGGTSLMKNVVLIGMLWKALGFNYDNIETEVKHKFGKKIKILPTNLKCLQAGYERIETQKLSIPKPQKPANRHMLINGNHAVALGAIHAGVRAYFAYPMSPSSSILTHMAEYAERTGVLVKQAEDEITVANMTVGAAHAGTRAMCATSGGGFDLMSETVSLAGMIETPFVCCVVQRPGPATGLPTWTGQGDLNLAIHSAHGEYARIVIGVSNPTDAFDLTQHAHNLSEEYQCPTIILSEKYVAEALVTVPEFDQKKIPIKRGLSDATKENLTSYDRFKITDSGVSKRWIPGSDEDAYYFANGDEHDEMGRLTEDAEPSKQMIAKRIRKLEAIKKNLPDPILLDEKSIKDSPVKGEQKGVKSQISFVGWGSSKSIMHDVIKVAAAEGITVNYLHYEYLWPLKTNYFEGFITKNKNLHLIEGNYTGQLGQLLQAHAKYEGKELFAGRLLKWNGRPFFVEEVMEYIRENIN